MIARRTCRASLTAGCCRRYSRSSRRFTVPEPSRSMPRSRVSMVGSGASCGGVGVSCGGVVPRKMPSISRRRLHTHMPCSHSWYFECGASQSCSYGARLVCGQRGHRTHLSYSPQRACSTVAASSRPRITSASHNSSGTLSGAGGAGRGGGGRRCSGGNDIVRGGSSAGGM